LQWSLTGRNPLLAFAAYQVVRLNLCHHSPAEFLEEPVPKFLEKPATELDEAASDLYLHARRQLGVAIRERRETAHERHSHRALAGILVGLSYDPHEPSSLVRVGEVHSPAKRHWERTHLDPDSSEIGPRVHHHVKLGTRDGSHDTPRVEQVIPHWRDRCAYDELLLDRD
jgi:hypothetical protein